MLFASRSKINSTRFRRSLASASPNVTPPPSAFPCAFSSPCVTGDRLGGCCRPTGRMDLRSKRGVLSRRCRLHSRNLRSETQRDRTPACLERSWRGPLGSSGAPPRPPTVPTAPLRGVHTFVKQVRWIRKRTNPLFVCLGLAVAWAWQPRSLRASPEPPSGQCALSRRFGPQERRKLGATSEFQVFNFEQTISLPGRIIAR